MTIESLGLRISTSLSVALDDVRSISAELTAKTGMSASDNPETKSDKPRKWLLQPRRTYRLNMTGPQFERDDPEEERFAAKLKPQPPRTMDDIEEDNAKLVKEMENFKPEPARPEKKSDDQDQSTRNQVDQPTRRVVGLM